MKWRLIIPIWTFACITFSSSFPIFVQDEMSVMYPIEYYPAYMQSDFINLDFTKWFKQAADSVKHFYNYVNNLIFGEVAREPIFGRYPTFKRNIPVANTVHSPEPESNIKGIQAFEIYKDSDGNMYVKNLKDPKGEIKLLQKITINSGAELQKPEISTVKETPQANSTKIPRNPFQWNENLENDKLFSGVFRNYAVNPQLLWNSGILPFQPLSAFNFMAGKVLDQNQSSQPPAIAFDKSQNREISSQKIEQDEPSSTTTSQPEIIIKEETESSSTSPTESPEAEITIINEESKNDEPSDNSNSSTDEKLSSDESSPYEITMSIERIPQNNSDSDESNRANQSKPETTEESDIFDETHDKDDDDNDTDTNNDDDDDNDDTDTNNDDDDDEDGNLTEFETDQMSSNDESDQQSQEPETTEKLTIEVTNDENTSENDDNDLTIVETSEPSEATEKAAITEETTVTKNTENNLKDSDESDIVKRVLAIVHPSKN